MFVLSSCLIVTASHPQACWNFGACFLGNRLKGRQHWYELLESYCLLFWVKEAEAPRDIHVPKVTLAGRVGLEKALNVLGSFLLPSHWQCVMEADSLPTHIVRSFIFTAELQQLSSLVVCAYNPPLPPRSEHKHGESKFMCKIIWQS